jgi:NAD(P)-dependent dehydrogenase (short-subunit alcohol dehydrogenase family)
MAKVHDWEVDEWNRIVALNLGGVFHGMKAAVPHILEAGGGSVVSTASISGTRPAAGEAPYSAAKAAVVALTANAALEYAPTVRVNSVSPGMIRTTMTGPLLGFEGMTERMETKTPLARIGEPEDIADVVVFLCSELARFVTGQNLVIDGGMTLHGAGVDGLYDYFFDLLQRSRTES